MKWFYSETIDMYVCLEPLVVSEKVLKAAESFGIKLDWNESGIIDRTDFASIKLLVEKLGGQIMSSAQYEKALSDAIKCKDKKAVESLTAKEFTEFFDDRGVISARTVDNITGESVIESGLPKDFRESGLTVRLMRKNEPTELVDEEEYEKIDRLIETGTRNDLEKYEKSELHDRVLRDEGTKAYRTIDRVSAKLGLLRLYQNRFGDRRLSYDDFCSYIMTGHQMFKRATECGKKVIFVMGHKNPDADSIVSAALEAYRLHLKQGNALYQYLPLIQADMIPSEITAILDAEVYSNLIYETDVDLNKLIERNAVRFIYVDQNYQKEYQKYVVAITDHHEASKVISGTYYAIPNMIERAGSTAALIARKFIGDGYTFDAPTAKMLYCAMLMSTCRRDERFMGETDAKIMDYVFRKSGIVSDEKLYRELMDEYMSETDVGTLYFRRYRHFNHFGITTIRVSDFIDRECFPRKIAKFISIASEQNRENDYPVSLIRILEYEKDVTLLKRERIYFVFGEKADHVLMKKVRQLILTVVKTYSEADEIKEIENYIEITGSTRKLTVNRIGEALDVLLSCFEKYVFVKSIGKWVATDFLKSGNATEKIGIAYSTDENGSICNISYLDAKLMTKRLGLDIMDLRDFWQTVSEAGMPGKRALKESFGRSDLSECIDTCSTGNGLLYRPEVAGNKLYGEEVDAEIIDAQPGLVCLREVSFKTGLPAIVHEACDYENKDLWKYISPEKGRTVAFARTFDSMRDLPSVEANVELNRRYQKLGIRPICESRPCDEVSVKCDEEGIKLLYCDGINDTNAVVYQGADFYG